MIVNKMGARSTLLLLCICFSLLYSSVSGTSNLACAEREETDGYICVCNSTYCDTIERPKEKSGKYYHYVTSATQPGFHLTTGSISSNEEQETSTSKLTFTVDADTTYQTFQGIGAGLSDSAAINFNLLSEKAQAKFIQSFFGEKGLEYVFGRVPIGATDFSTRFYTLDDVEGDVDLTNFALAEEDTNLRIPMIKQAVAASERGLNLLCTAWTAPAWMKENNSSSVGYLKAEYQQTYAQYLVRYLEEYQNEGVDFWGITHGNEILMGFETQFNMPNMLLLPPQLKTWSRDYFVPLMKNSSFADMKIITLDDERTFLTWYAKELLEDDDTAQYIDGVAMHWYFDSESNTYILDDFYEQYPDKFMIYTETSTSVQSGPNSNGYTTTLGSWSVAETYIDDIMQNFNHYVTGYMDWNICLNEEGGPYLQMALESSVVVNSTSGEFYKQPLFYALGHFSKFITPGAVRINVTTDGNVTYSYQNDIHDDFVVDTNVDAIFPGPTGGGGPTGGPGPQPTGQSGGPGPQPTGQSGGPGPQPTGQSGGPGPQPTGQSGGPGPNPTTTPSASILSLAALNPDGSHTFIIYNGKSESISITIEDKQKGSITKTITEQSLNTFVYW